MLNKYSVYRKWRAWAEEVENTWIERLEERYPEPTIDDISDDEIELSEQGQELLAMLTKYASYEEYLAAQK